eukprot:Phypoly_transcript_10714.p2 GENE.Phypoly_transcript_10714~~Phypoly_transcript_10714.p2  ORF type:complete len:109 (-),score=6.01 Phypoly_transcript_10714:718-1044(-)
MMQIRKRLKRTRANFDNFLFPARNSSEFIDKHAGSRSVKLVNVGETGSFEMRLRKYTASHSRSPNWVHIIPMYFIYSHMKSKPFVAQFWRTVDFTCQMYLTTGNINQI